MKAWKAFAWSTASTAKADQALSTSTTVNPELVEALRSCSSVAAAAAAPEEAWGLRLAAEAIGAAAYRGASAEARAARRRALVPRVLRWVPLPVLLLARAGLPTPLTLAIG